MILIKNLNKKETKSDFLQHRSDGRLKENEKIKGSWFLVRYSILKVDKSVEKLITHVEAIAESK